MSNENKIRILYVQPSKYPEERLAANELHPLQRLVGGERLRGAGFRKLERGVRDRKSTRLNSSHHA